MLKSLRRLVVCAIDFKNELLIIKISLNVTNVFMFLLMQSLERNSLKSVIRIHYQNTLKFKKILLTRMRETDENVYLNKQYLSTHQSFSS